MPREVLPPYSHEGLAFSFNLHLCYPPLLSAGDSNGDSNGACICATAFIIAARRGGVASSCICTCFCVLTKLCLKAPRHLVLLLKQDVHQCAREGSPPFVIPSCCMTSSSSFLDGHGARMIGTKQHSHVGGGYF